MTTVLEGGEWSAARPGRTLPPGKTRFNEYVYLYQEYCFFFITVWWRFWSDGIHFMRQASHSDMMLCTCSCLTELFTSHDTHHSSESNSMLGLRLFNVLARTDMPPLYLNVFNDKVEWEAVWKVSDRSPDNGDLLWRFGYVICIRTG